MVCEIIAKPRYRFDAKGHVHYLDDKPLMGTSTVVSVIAKQLSFWAAGMAVKEFGVPDPKVLTKVKNGKATKAEKETLYAAAEQQLQWFNGMAPGKYVQTCVQAYFAHSKELKETADAGTDLHAMLSSYVQTCIDHSDGFPSRSDGYQDEVDLFSIWALANVKRFLWSEKHCYSEKLWVGGICDCGALLNNDRVAVIDFKSGKGPFFSQHVQTGGYAALIAENGLLESDGTPNGNVGIKADDCIVFAFKGKGPRIEKAQWLIDEFVRVVGLYKGQQRYDQ